METLKTVVGYGRVSTKNQAEEGYSIDAQKQSIGEYAKKNNENAPDSCE